MRRTGRHRPRRSFADVAFVWVQVFWSCSCDYNNVATYSCRGCGARPPRELRDAVNALPVTDAVADAEVAAAG